MNQFGSLRGFKYFTVFGRSTEEMLVTVFNNNYTVPEGGEVADIAAEKLDLVNFDPSRSLPELEV